MLTDITNIQITVEKLKKISSFLLCFIPNRITSSITVKFPTDNGAETHYPCEEIGS